MDLTRQIDLYVNHERECYDAFKQLLERCLSLARDRFAPMGQVQTRVKAPESFAEKCLRKADMYPDPVYDLIDLCGARVVVQTERQVEEVCRFIRAVFKVDEKNSEDVLSRLKASEFGYRSVHFAVQVSEQVTDVLTKRFGLEEKAAAALREHIKKVNGSDKEGKPRERKAEIQVCTVLQHVWSDDFHDRTYKTRINLPEAYKREAHRMAALLEKADAALGELMEKMDALEVDYGAYADERSLIQQIEILRTILGQPSLKTGKAGLALRLARLARAKQAWDEIIPLAQYVPAGVPEDLRLEIATALCRKNAAQPDSAEFKRGAEKLHTLARPVILPRPYPANPLRIITEKLAASACMDEASCRPGVIEPDRLRARALREVAWSVQVARKGNFHADARDLYHQAHLLAPENPYLFADFLDAHVKAEKDLSCSVVLTSAIEAAVSKCDAHAAAEVELPYAFFAAAKLRLIQGRTDEALIAFCKGISKARNAALVDEQLESILDLQEHLRSVPPEISSGLECLRRLAVLGTVVKGSNHGRIARHGATRDDRGQCAMSNGFPERVDEPVVIVAGGTMAGQNMAPYREMLDSAIQGFSGTIFSGGTTAGISGIVGDAVGTGRASLTLMASLPSKYRVSKVDEHRAYKIFHTDGDDFSALEPLQNWIDLLGAGVKPAGVRLLAINGGRITRFEIHLAVALGTVAGVVEASGREADQVLREKPWWPTGRLVSLPSDRMTVRAFLHAAGTATDFKKVNLADTTVDLEPVAQKIHESYLQFKDGALSPWAKLSDDFKIANYQQALYAARLLETAGLALAPTVPPGKQKIDDLAKVLSKDQMEKLAEMEHGRWNVERLLAGWKLGPKKDVVAKLHHCLVPYRELSEEIKGFDRDAVSGWPEHFKASGLVIYKK